MRLKRIRDGREDYELLTALAAQGRGAEAMQVARDTFGSQATAAHHTALPADEVDGARCYPGLPERLRRRLLLLVTPKGGESGARDSSSPPVWWFSMKFGARVAELAGTQHGVVTRSQLRGVGVTARQVERWVNRGDLRVLHRATYLSGPIEPAHAPRDGG